MKIKYKEDPKEWRKSTLLTSLGLATISSVLRWRKHLPLNAWLILLGVLGFIAIGVLLQPNWFRGWYRLSLWMGFYSSQFIGRCVLFLFFIFIITPVGILLRLTGKDPLRFKRPSAAKTCWHPSKDSSPLDRLF